ncbi:hypothetical protein PRECH8_00190 [Insulibacter thermoxylanivorax]|uniref:Protein-glutamine gamma-glutamyltransferase-like C-terminal domain-containing protein n=1 Tax=Insulibacter thermoxylanivorax TaxID=2749268 RepID=A0A916QCR5_9BACL|nr:DUF4129 domain-containing protein [Insulibacter thermoxylanivorax]GFR36723.1 hypothetical protein PRECH8_00190 [Insulibacter thermoxylanivorax]
MKLVYQVILRPVLAWLLETLLAMPVLLFVHLYVIPDRMFWIWIISFALFYVLGCLLRRIWSRQPLSLRHLLFMFISALYAWAVFGLSAAAAISLPAVWLALVRGGLYAAAPIQFVLTNTYYVVSIMLYFALSVVIRFSVEMAPIASLTSWFAMFALAVSLFMMNQYALNRESLQEEQQRVVTRSILWKNRLLIILFAGFILLVAGFKQLAEGLQALWNMILRIVVWFLSLGIGGEPAQQPPMNPNLQEMLPMEEQEPALFWVILEQIAMSIALVLAVVIGLFMLYKIGEALISGLRYLYQWFKGRLFTDELEQAAALDYEDEVTRLVEWNDLRKQLGERLRTFFEREPRIRWISLSNNQERIRCLYRESVIRAIQDGYRFRPSLTPRELQDDANRWRQGQGWITKELVLLYEQARYGGEEPSDQEIEQLRSRLQERKP